MVLSVIRYLGEGMSDVASSKPEVIVMGGVREDVFVSEQAKEVITYAREKYGDELEFLWQKFSRNAVLRNKKTRK